MIDMLGFLKKEVSQNKIMAPPIRRSVTTNGVTAPPSMINLETGDINPHMILAPNIEA